MTLEGEGGRGALPPLAGRRRLCCTLRRLWPHCEGGEEERGRQRSREGGGGESGEREGLTDLVSIHVDDGLLGRLVVAEAHEAEAAAAPCARLDHDAAESERKRKRKRGGRTRRGQPVRAVAGIVRGPHHDKPWFMTPRLWAPRWGGS